MYDAETKLRDLLHDAAPETGAVPFDPIARRVARRRNRLVVAASAATAGVLVSGAVLLSAPAGTPVADPPGTGTGTVTSTRLETDAPRPGPTAAGSGGTEENRPAQDCVPGPDNVEVDYLDVLRYAGRTYRATGRRVLARPMPPGVPFPGPQIGTVTCMLSDTKPDPYRTLQDGDAAFLPVGTPLRAVYDDPTTFRIAASTSTGTWLYEVTDGSGVTTGGDLLPLHGKVSMIEVLDEARRRVLGRITDPESIATVIGGIGTAPLTTATASSNNELFVRFVTAAGPTREWVWFVDASRLESIQLPATADDLLRSAAHVS